MKEITTTIEQAAEIRAARQNSGETRRMWEIVADVMGIDRDADFNWSSLGGSSSPDKYNRLVIRVIEE